MTTKKNLHFAFLIFLTVSQFGCAAGKMNRAKDRKIAALPPTGSGESWEPVVQLKDTTNTFVGVAPDLLRPADGWWVTPIHATLLSDGDVLVTGWGRIDYDNCQVHKTRQNGESYLLSPADFTGGKDRTYQVKPINEDPRAGFKDVLYCAGNVTLKDGRILMVGGARYQNLGDKPGEQEYGLSYSRIFTPETNEFSRVEFAPKGSPAKLSSMTWYENGMMWYPTETRLPGGKVFVAGGFDRNCSDSSCVNRDLEMFDPDLLDKNLDPWTTWVASDQQTSNVYDPGIKDYTHSFLLAQPVPAALGGGVPRDMILTGYSGRIGEVSLDRSLDPTKRFLVPSDDANHSFVRPSAENNAWDSSAALVGTGEILIVGGGGGAKAEAQRIDLYNPQTGTWRSKDTGITRHNPSTTLLPDGTVLIVNGEPGDDTANAVGDRHQPQIYDPFTDQLVTLASWPDSVSNADRGYHNFSILLKDGRIMLGGGMVTLAEVGCERPDLRIFNPPYLKEGSVRPIISPRTEGQILTIGKSFSLAYSGAELRTTRGVVLMALGSETHSFDQNQRYVPLNFTKIGTHRLKVDAPSSSTIAPEGDYILFAISTEGVPSEGRAIHLR